MTRVGSNLRSGRRRSPRSLTALLMAVVLAAAVIAALRIRKDLDAEENVAMTNDAYKAWLDAMPIDDVQHRIERLDQKLSDLRCLERLYAGRAGDVSPPEPFASEPSAEPADSPSEPEGEGSAESGEAT